MSKPDAGSNPQAGTTIEPIIAAFERAWRSSSPPSVSEFVAGCDPGLKHRLALELVLIDMEFRWQASAQGDVANDLLGGQPKWADYVARLPDVGELGQIPPELVAEEYRIRQLWGDRPKHDRFISSFSSQFTRLPKLLAIIDEDLRADGAIIAEAHPPSTTISTPSDPRAPLPWSDYILHELLGSGGFGKVYRATQTSLDRPVAIKSLHKARQRDPHAVDQFVLEARALARLRHNGIVGVHGLGRFPGGGYFLALDLIKGVDLQKQLDQGPLSIDSALRITMAVADAIQHAHERGVIHGDLKPSNVLIDDSGHAYVTDFGLAQLLPTADTLSQRSQFQGGTIAYLAPEIARGGEVSLAVDVYGLGALLYALLTGKPPRQGSAKVILADLVAGRPTNRPVTLRSDIPAALDAVAIKCLAANAEQRFATAAEVTAALKNSCDSHI